MGFRFRKSVRIAKGVRLNFSKSGVSATFGGKGFTTSVGRNGTRVNVGIPGTGVSYSKKIGGGSSRGRGSSGGMTASQRNDLMAVQAIADYVGDSGFKFDVNVTEKGEIVFLGPDGGVVEDKHLVSLLKKHPSYKASKKTFEQMALEKSREHAEALEEQTGAFVDIYRLAPAIWPAHLYAKKLDTLKPERYVREQFRKLPPTRESAFAALEPRAEEEVKAFLPWKRKRQTEEWIEARLDDELARETAEWQREKDEFERCQDDVERARNREFAEAYESAKRELELAIAGDGEYVERWIDDWLSTCELPVEMGVDFDYRQEEGKVLVDLDLPEIEDLPTVASTQLASGKFKEKNKTQKQIKEEYARCVFGLTTVVAATLFNASPKIEHVIVSGYTQRRNKAGDVSDDYIISVDFVRERMQSLDYAIANPESTVLEFPNRMNRTVSGLFKAIEPFE